MSVYLFKVLHDYTFHIKVTIVINFEFLKIFKNVSQCIQFV